jgi:hypothetical protein
MNKLTRCFLALGLLIAITQVGCSSKKKGATTSASTGISSTINGSKF